MNENEMKENGEALSIEQVYSLFMAHMLNNNLEKLRIYKPNDRDDANKLKLFIFYGIESGRPYVDIELNAKEH